MSENTSEEDASDVGVVGSRVGALRSAVDAFRERREPIHRAVWMVRRQLLLSVAVFFAFALVGYFLVGPAVTDELARAPMTDPDCRTPTDGFISDTTAGYFTNNVGVAVVMMGGMGLLTVGAMAYNGILMGAAWHVTVGLGASNQLVAACVLPHAVVEVPGLWLAGAFGLFLPWRAASYLLGRREAIVDPVEEANLVQLFVLVTATILLAAVIEAHVSELVARVLLGPP